MQKGGYFPSVVLAGCVVVALVALGAMSRVDFLLFHSLSEIVSVGIAWGVFFIAWNARRFGASGLFLVLGIGYFHVGVLDLVHTLSYSGLGIVNDGGNAATQLWVAARYLEATVLVGSLLFLRRVPPAALHAGLASVVGLTIVAIFLYPLFPDCYVPTVGQTNFKIVSEYAVIALFALGAALLVRRRGELECTVWKCLLGCYALRILSEFAFTTYAGVYDDANMIGHLLKDAGYYLFYRAIIPAALLRPYEMVFRDVAAAREALALAERRFRMAIRPAPILVFSQDASLRYDWVFAGDGVTGRLPQLGQSDSEFLGRRDAAVIDSVKAQVLSSGHGVRRRVRLGKRQRFFDLNVEPLRQPDGSVAGIIGAAIDVTELVEARTEAERANQAKSRFLASASHDLRQPFQAMRLFQHMLADRTVDPVSQAIAGKLDEAMAAGEDLLRALLDVSTLEAGTLRPRVIDFPLATVLNQIAAEVEPQAAARALRLRVVPCSAVVRSDPTLLGRIVRNLASNALRYTAKGGILIGCRRAGREHLRIVVCDTGIGIAPDQLDAIFDDFYQVGNAERDREKGLGLGLAVVQRVARLLDHPVEVRSVLGRGSSFALTVPLADTGMPQDSGQEAIVPAH